MNVPELHDGTQRASALQPHIAPPVSPVPHTLRDLLTLIERDNGMRKGMLHSTATRVAEFFAKSVEDVSLDLMFEQRLDFVAHLRAGKYAENSVKSYRNYVNIMIKIAQDNGWSPRATRLPADWAIIEEMLKRGIAKSIVHYAVRIGRTTKTFSEEDLAAWQQEKVREGVSYRTTTTYCYSFRSAVVRARDRFEMPLIKCRFPHFGVPIKKMHPSLRLEIEELIDWKTSDLQFDRPTGAKVRPVSAKAISDCLSHLAGYGQNILSRTPYQSLIELVTRELVQGYAKWAMKERRVKPQSLSVMLGKVFAALRHNPRYEAMDLNWFETMLGQLVPEDQSVIDDRKARKYIPYAEAELIPAKIRAERQRRKGWTPRDIANSFQDELLMQWLVILPWRQRNIGECRISGNKPNLFKGPIKPFSTATKPDWIAEQESRAPNSEYWQFQFESSETKTGKAVFGFLPRDLVSLVEEFIAHSRPLLLRNGSDPGTLFLDSVGGAASTKTVTGWVKKVASKYSGVPVTPHIFRDIVAFGWLSVFPEDYLTVSKLLWHSNINTTLRIYGRRFDESTGVARMDNWRANRLKVAA